MRKVEKDDDEVGKNKVHPRAMHEGVNEWVSYGTQRTWRQVKSGVGGRHRASLCVTMDGYMRRGKAGLKNWDERSERDDSEMCNVRCVEVLI